MSSLLSETARLRNVALRMMSSGGLRMLVALKRPALNAARMMPAKTLIQMEQRIKSLQSPPGGGSVPIHRSWNSPGPVARPEPLVTHCLGVNN